MLFAAALTTALSWGQGATDFGTSTTVLEPSDLSWGLGDTVGSPSVSAHRPFDVLPFWPSARVLLMAYETQTEAPSTACPAGRWGVGLAIRIIGTGFFDLGPVVEPTPGTYYSCVAAHPALVQLTDVEAAGGQTWLLYFKAEQDCSGKGSSCERYPGVGRAVISYEGVFEDPAYVVTGPDTTPVLEGVAQNMGYPKAAFVDGEYRLAFGQFPDIYMASSPLTDDFTVSASPVLTASTPTGWGDDELLSPAVHCEGSSTMKMYPVGRSWSVSQSILDDVSVGGFVSTSPGTDFDAFTEINATPYFSTSDSDEEIRHVHMVTSNSYAHYGLFYSTPLGAGNIIRFASTPSYSWRNTDFRRCP